MVLLTTYCVGASVLLVAVFTVFFRAQPEDLPAYYIPAVIVPLLVAPPVIHLLLGLATALEAAHAESARQQLALQRDKQLDLAGRLAGGLAHDFNNLLTIVRANVEALGGPSANEELAAIDDAAARGAWLTRRLLSISHHNDVALAPYALSSLLRETESVLRRVLPAGVGLEFPDEIPDAVLQVDRDAVQQALLNLVLNARDAMDSRGRLTISVARHEAPDGSWLVFTVRDNGHGMSPELLARAVEPFFTTKSAHQGTGLGLSIVKRTMEQHGGRLVLESDVGVGTSAALWFPLRATAPDAAVVQDSARSTPAPPVPSESSVAPKRAYRLLVVDDDPQVRAVTARTVERLGHRVISVSDATAALAQFAAGASVDLIISDVMMPGTTGIELVQQLRRSGHDTPVLLVSGYAVDDVDQAVGTDPAVAFLAKPWSVDGLARGINGVITAKGTSR